MNRKNEIEQPPAAELLALFVWFASDGTQGLVHASKALFL